MTIAGSTTGCAGTRRSFFPRRKRPAAWGKKLPSVTEPPEKKPTADKKGASVLRGPEDDMGSALRGIYQRTVDEAIPDEFLSLLGKLD